MTRLNRVIQNKNNTTIKTINENSYLEFSVQLLYTEPIPVEQTIASRITSGILVIIIGFCGLVAILQFPYKNKRDTDADLK